MRCCSDERKKWSMARRKISSLLVSQIFDCFSVLERTFYILVQSIESKDFNCNLLLLWYSPLILFRCFFEYTKSLFLLLIYHAYTGASPLMRKVLLWASKILADTISSCTDCHVSCIAHECVRVYSVAKRTRLCQKTCVATIRIAESSIATLVPWI
jgi:hypothetical protein